MKKVALAFVVSSAMLAAAVPTTAVAAGKVANQTQEGVAQALLDTISAAEETLAAMKSGAEKDDVMALLKKTKQTAKTIESAVVLADRDRALAKVKKSRSAYKKDQHAKAEQLMEDAVERFIKVNAKYHAF
ncbi:MAG: hypothetical protein GQ582_11005 [Methyloprofundus sp.]|nr:hypothetical protein [Methyloprofundus sp.]